IRGSVAARTAKAALVADADRRRGGGAGRGRGPSGVGGGTAGARPQGARPLPRRRDGAGRRARRRRRRGAPAGLGFRKVRRARSRRLSAPGRVRIAADPAGAQVFLERRAPDGAPQLEPLGVAPVEAPLPAGSHLLVLRAPGRAELRYPILIAHGESLALELPL